MADLHGHADQLSRLKGLNADLIAFCGDLHNSGTIQEARPIARALASQSTPVFIVPGNMDPKGFVLDLWQEVGLTVLHDKSSQLRETGFIGFGGMAIHNPMRISDLARFYLPEEEVYKSLANTYMEISDLPRRVVLSHQPPRGARDTIHSGEAVGSLSLRRFIDGRRIEAALPPGLRRRGVVLEGLQPIGGLTNRNYKLFVGGEALVLRLPGRGTGRAPRRRGRPAGRSASPA